MTSTATVSRRESLRRRRAWMLLSALLTMVVWGCALLVAALPINAQESCRFGSVTPKTGTRPRLRNAPNLLASSLFTPEKVLLERECILRQTGDFFELATGEYVHRDNVTFVLPINTFTPLASPTKVTPVPTLAELVVYAKVFLKVGNTTRADLGIIQFRGNEPISCELVRVDLFPQPSPTVTALSVP